MASVGREAQPACIGLVDSGVDNAARSALGDSLLGVRAFDWDEAARSVTANQHGIDALQHGSKLATTVCAIAPAAQLLMARVFFQRWLTRPAQVAAAVDWLCASGAQVINLSLGLRADRAILRDACNRALACGVILVASAPARGESVFPAAYPGVIRATGDARCDRMQWSWLDSTQADVGGCVTALDESVAGASAGAACVSAHIARFLDARPGAGRAQVLDHLRHRAAYVGPERRTSAPDQGTSE